MHINIICDHAATESQEQGSHLAVRDSVHARTLAVYPVRLIYALQLHASVGLSALFLRVSFWGYGIQLRDSFMWLAALWVRVIFHRCRCSQLSCQQTHALWYKKSIRDELQQHFAGHFVPAAPKSFWGHKHLVTQPLLRTAWTRCTARVPELGLVEMQTLR